MPNPKTIKEIVEEYTPRRLREAIKDSLLSLLDEVEKRFNGVAMPKGTADEINKILSDLRDK